MLRTAASASSLIAGRSLKAIVFGSHGRHVEATAKALGCLQLDDDVRMGSLELVHQRRQRLLTEPAAAPTHATTAGRAKGDHDRPGIQWPASIS